MDGDVIVVGAKDDDQGETSCGAMYTYLYVEDDENPEESKWWLAGVNVA